MKGYECTSEGYECMGERGVRAVNDGPEIVCIGSGTGRRKWG